MTGSCGPNALQVFEKAGIQVVTGVSGSVSQVVQQFTAGSLKSAPSAQTSPGFSGITGSGKGGVVVWAAVVEVWAVVGGSDNQFSFKSHENTMEKRMGRSDIKKVSIENKGLQRLITKYRRNFRIPENLKYYSTEDFKRAEKRYLKHLLNGEL